MDKKIIKNFNILDIKPYKKNYLNHGKNVEFIKNSLLQFGYIKTSIVMDEKNVLLAGHGTLEAMKLLEWEKVPEVIQIAGLTVKQKSAYRIADNTTAKDAEINFDNLSAELELIGNTFVMEDFGCYYDIEIPEFNEDEPDCSDSLIKWNVKFTSKEYNMFKKKCFDLFSVDIEKSQLQNSEILLKLINES